MDLYKGPIRPMMGKDVSDKNAVKDTASFGIP